MRKFATLLIGVAMVAILAKVMIAQNEAQTAAENTPSEAVDAVVVDEVDDGTTDLEHAPPIETEHESTVKVGDKAPDFTLPNADGQMRTLSDILKRGPVVLTFYRGGWCPYCNDQLYAYQQILPEFMDLGAELVAISPEKPESAQDTVLKNEVKFEILSDVGNVVTRQYDLLWEVPEDKREGFSGWLQKETGKTLAEFNGIGEYELPIPATFVIAQDGTVVYVFKDEDYKKRADMDDILKALENLDEHMPE